MAISRDFRNLSHDQATRMTPDSPALRIFTHAYKRTLNPDRFNVYQLLYTVGLQWHDTLASMAAIGTLQKSLILFVTPLVLSRDYLAMSSSPCVTEAPPYRGLMHVKSVEAQSLLVDMVWSSERGTGSGVFFVT
ncbi:hypothetical protein TNCV_3289771 [Trichonephila clavipes]|nr:hypothetical protein TNCV_3289771 [Trichonephila clavipes]